MKIFRPDFCVEITENSEKAPGSGGSALFRSAHFSFFSGKQVSICDSLMTGIPAFFRRAAKIPVSFGESFRESSVINLSAAAGRTALF